MSANCPVPISRHPHVVMAHGGGGRLMQQLIEQVFLSAFGRPPAGERHDAAVRPFAAGRLAFTTDSYVVRPLFFPGGDIGTLAVNGTVNDLAMSGARPLFLSCAFILEEGLPMDVLSRVTASMQAAAREAGVSIVTGDTKVVDRGKGDGIFVNTAGIGAVEHERVIAPRSVADGDVVIVSGDLGRHGMAIMAVREGLEFETSIESDCAPLSAPVLALLEAGIGVHCLRDLTRGGLASALNEIAEDSGLAVAIEEAQVPVREDVRGACELLGFDPLYVANEGRFVAFVPAGEAGPALDVLARYPVSAGSRVIGRVSSGSRPMVTMKSRVGGTRVVDMLSGEQLPRIC